MLQFNIYIILYIKADINLNISDHLSKIVCHAVYVMSVFILIGANNDVYLEEIVSNCLIVLKLIN
jgi:hypothetical protein